VVSDKRAFANLAYIYFDYMIQQTIAGLVKCGARGFAPPRNDAIDGMLCLHLRLDENINFVTNDNALAETVRKVISAQGSSDSVTPALCTVQAFDDYSECHLK
jgi:hypothetical protein